MGSVECSLERGGGARSPGRALRLFRRSHVGTSARCKFRRRAAGVVRCLERAAAQSLRYVPVQRDMGQHLLLTLVFPPLLLYGTPAHVVRPLLRPRWVMTLGRVLTRPLAAALVFTGPIVIWHVPSLYEAALRHHNLHIVQHVVFLATAVIMWWPVLSPVPELPRIPHLLQMLYLFLLGIPMSITGALITLSGSVLYPFYAAAPRVWNLSPMDDQQIGGLLMWVLGGLMLWLVMTVIWFRYSVWDARSDAERAVPLDAYGVGGSGPGTGRN